MNIDRISTAYHHDLNLVSSDVLKLAEAMPAELYAFAPVAGVRTFAEQVRHLATMIYLTAALLIEERSPFAPGPGDSGPPELIAKQQIIEYLKGSVEYARRALATLNEQTHLDTVQTYFGPMTKAAVAAGIAYHSYNHYGQMVVYARLNGVTPPAL